MGFSYIVINICNVTLMKENELCDHCCATLIRMMCTVIIFILFYFEILQL